MKDEPRGFMARHNSHPALVYVFGGNLYHKLYSFLRKVERNVLEAIADIVHNRSLAIAIGYSKE